MEVAVVMPVAVVLRGHVGREGAFVVDRRVVVMMIVIVDVKAGNRLLTVHVAVHARSPRPGKLERQQQHEEEGKQTTHRGIVAERPGNCLPGRRSPRRRVRQRAPVVWPNLRMHGKLRK